MHVELSDEGYLNITAINDDQAKLIGAALEASPQREFGNDAALAPLQSGSFEEIVGLARNQVSMLAFALRDSPDQQFMDDPELRKLFKLMAVLTSEVFDDMTSGQFDFNRFKLQ